LRKLRLLAVAVIAVLGIAAVAYAQDGGNTYTVNGGTTTRGGTAKKPKPAGLNFTFSLAAGDNVPQVVQTYEIKVEGGKVNTDILPTCTPAKMDAAQTDSGCPAKAKIGSGTLTALVGNAGQPVSAATPCTLPFQIYNAGHNKAALWIKAGPPDCIAAVAEAVPATWTKSGNTAGLKFTVPDGLRHQLGLDLPVVKAAATIKKITGKLGKGKKAKKVGYLESIGCKDKKRDFSVVFTTEDGQSKTVKKTLPYC